MLKNIISISMLSMISSFYPLNIVQAQTSQAELIQEFAQTYAQIAYLNYQDAGQAAGELKKKIEEFLKDPSSASLDETKKAWLDARIPYGQTEVFCFADGPIDGQNDKGEEGP